MKHTKIIVALLALLIVSISCDDDTSDFKIYGSVSYGNGRPVPNAAIHIRNYTEPGGFNYHFTPSNISIGVEAPERGHYLVEVFRFGSAEVLAEVVNDTLNSGQYRFPVSGYLLSNGVYRHEVTGPSGKSEHSFFVGRSDDALPGINPLTHTDQAGRFTIDIDLVAIGKKFNGLDGSEFQIGDSLQVLVTNNKSVIGREFTRVKMNRHNVVNVKLN